LWFELLNPLQDGNMILFDKTIESLSNTFLGDRSKKYRCNPWYIYSEGILFLIIIKEINHLQSIDLSLSEQSFIIWFIKYYLYKMKKKLNDKIMLT
jgi:hypothetical protein